MDHPALARGIAWLTMRQEEDGLAGARRTTRAAAFPRVFYLNYPRFIRKFFPLWALARYRNLKASNMRRVEYGL